MSPSTTDTLSYTLLALGLSTSIAAYLLLLRPLDTQHQSLSSPQSHTTPHLPSPKPCKYPLATHLHTHTFRLTSGRTMAYAEYGDPAGRVVLYFHGLPGSRVEGARYHALGRELGVRVVAVERPGYGMSDGVGEGEEWREGGVVRWAGEVGELVRGLGVVECGVLGISGGGPYALALTHALPCIRATSIICGIGPPHLSKRGASLRAYLGFTLGWRYSPPQLLSWFFSRDAATSIALPDAERLRILLSRARHSTLDPADQRFFADEDEMRVLVASSREALARGYDAMCRDGYAVCVDWGFRVEDVRKDVPVVLWYGARDETVPVEHGRAIARWLRSEEEQGDGETAEKGELEWRERVRLRVLDDTHVSVSMRDKRGYLVELLKAWDAGVGKGRGEGLRCGGEGMKD